MRSPAVPATDLRQCAPARTVEEQGMRAERFTVPEFEAMVRAGAIKDTSTIAAYGLLLTG